MGSSASILQDAYDQVIAQAPRPLRHLGEFDRRTHSELTERASWTHDPGKKKRRLERMKAQRKKAGKDFNDRTRDFALSNIKYKGGKDNYSWECTGILGQGAFGIVGLWQQIGHDGRTMDSVAVKQVERDRDARVVECKDSTSGTYKVPMEALIMYEMRGTPTVCGLRSLKRYDGREKTWRIFQEYCSGGTVRDMIKVYQEWNRKNPKDQRRIPRVYVWYVLYGLAKALVAMDRGGMCRQMVHKRADALSYVLHLDIKDINVLLGAGPLDGPLKMWPTVKVCDWGLARVTSDHDSSNCDNYYGTGTPSWFPPEQWGSGGYARLWKNDIHPKGTPFTHAHACWQFAALIYGMVMLDTDNKILYDALKKDREEEDYYESNNYNLFKAQNGGDLSEHYGPEMLHFLERCLNLAPTFRPSPEELLRVTRWGSEISGDKWIRDFREARRKDKLHAPYVFYGKNGYEDMRNWIRADNSRRR